MLIKELYPCAFNLGSIGISDITTVSYTISITPEDRIPVPIMGMTDRTHYWLQCSAMQDCFSAVLCYLPRAAVFEKSAAQVTVTTVGKRVYLSSTDIYTTIILSNGLALNVQAEVLEGVMWYPTLEELELYKKLTACPTAHMTVEGHFVAAALRRRKASAFVPLYPQ